MYIQKRESKDLDIYYIWEKIRERKDTIIGFIMETFDQGFDIDFNQRRIFLLREYADILARKGNMNQFKQTILDFFSKKAVKKATPMAPVTSFYIINEMIDSFKQ